MTRADHLNVRQPLNKNMSNRIEIIVNYELSAGKLYQYANDFRERFSIHRFVYSYTW